MYYKFASESVGIASDSRCDYLKDGPVIRFEKSERCQGPESNRFEVDKRVRAYRV
jgi:hypothetical protein